MTARWYALHSKPMREALLWEQLNLHKIESFYPRLHVRPANPRSRKIRAYFPGYVFGRVDLAQSSAALFRRLPGSAGIVGFDGIPSHIPDHLIAAIRRRVDEINAAGGELFYRLKAGDTVTIEVGPFRGCEAIFDARLSGQERVRVLLKLLHRERQLALELPASQIALPRQEQ